VVQPPVLLLGGLVHTGQQGVQSVQLSGDGGRGLKGAGQWRRHVMPEGMERAWVQQLCMSRHRWRSAQPGHSTPLHRM
jgi:hypothetical protein